MAVVLSIIARNNMKTKGDTELYGGEYTQKSQVYCASTGSIRNAHTEIKRSF